MCYCKIQNLQSNFIIKTVFLLYYHITVINFNTVSHTQLRLKLIRKKMQNQTILIPICMRQEALTQNLLNMTQLYTEVDSTNCLLL